MPLTLGFQHTYGSLPSRFYARVDPTAVANPQLFVFNRPLAAELGLDAKVVEPEAAALFSGNTLPQDARPLAMAYAGHQYGGFVPRLGDGRAILLGELKGRDGDLRDIQLKGAGPTPFSRSGDGRAALGPMLREYLISEAMHAFGVPTTRSLAVITTGEKVYRDQPLPGAVLTRVATSHVRVGTFQYFAAREDAAALRDLLDFVIKRHYPAARDADSPALAVLQAVTQQQAVLIADWMLLGFIHGVMNTDNMAISGETLDYGPCAFMDDYDPETVFSSIDRNGRYAYANQPAIAQWNLARFGETLLPLIHPDIDTAVGLATQVIEPFISQFDALFLAGMLRKIGLSAASSAPVGVTPASLATARSAPASPARASATAGSAAMPGRTAVSALATMAPPPAGREALMDDHALIGSLLQAMQRSGADFTLTFRRLTLMAASPDEQPRLREVFSQAADIDDWLKHWQARWASDPQSAPQRIAGMRAANPAFIPRNHRVEAALNAAEAGDYAPFHKLLEVLQHPFDEQPGNAEYSHPPQPSERVLQTFCGT